jgi:protein O-GlcNAc transferase
VGGQAYGVLLQQAEAALADQRHAAAETLLRQALALDAASPLARRKLVVALLFLGKTEEAQSWLAPLLEAHPRDANLLFNQAVVWIRLKKPAEAGATLQNLIALYPDHVQGRVHLANLLLHDPERAMAVLQPVLAQAPTDAELSFMLGCVCERLRDPKAAVAHYAQALVVNPGHVEALSNWLFTQHYVYPVDNEQVKATAVRHGQHVFEAAQRQGWVKPPRQRQPARPVMRIGVLSSDLRANVVGHFLASVLEALGQRRVELIAYANQGAKDPQAARIRAAFSRWHQILSLSDAKVADLIESDELDVLLDLNGHTKGHRLGVLLRRPAPRQVSWLGYFGTTGMPFIDAVITDPHCVPANEAHHFSEPLLRMPHSRFCLTAPAEAPAIAPDPPMASSPVITFACFQNLTKINGAVLALWRRVLEAVPASVLRLQSLKLDNAGEARRLRDRLVAAGIDWGRVRLMAGQPRDKYLEQYNEVDVLLDTFPYPGGTTTAEAIWMGVPTITLATPGMLGRQGQAMLENVGLGDWVVHSEDGYVAMALALAQERAATVARLGQLRQSLRETALKSPLFDAQRFAKDLERLLRNFCARTLS